VPHMKGLAAAWFKHLRVDSSFLYDTFLVEMIAFNQHSIALSLEEGVSNKACIALFLLSLIAGTMIIPSSMKSSAFPNRPKEY
jgi:hypothetical protein